MQLYSHGIIKFHAASECLDSEGESKSSAGLELLSRLYDEARNRAVGDGGIVGPSEEAVLGKVPEQTVSMHDAKSYRME